MICFSGHSLKGSLPCGRQQPPVIARLETSVDGCKRSKRGRAIPTGLPVWVAPFSHTSPRGLSCLLFGFNVITVLRSGTEIPLASHSVFWSRKLFYTVSSVSMGYGLDNENIRLLRLRSFTIGRPLADEELMSPNAQDKIAALIGIMEPFVTYLNSVVMPDPEDMDASSGSESTD
ncbi:hypothetical protein BDV30DRAFT_41646 [Aspergillus minisclerotigenes]|uniref:Uncharacterized protein n=1 Tax=Aspergillus minisclerotigenes TaxID=656917 RepID=A0A5N6IM17_9EURO|nr:hypothetical protein BDV30DRAFT_41646 [Aspergillus minisclerotigenes]